MKKTLLTIAILANAAFLASPTEAHESNKAQVFYSYESNGDDYIAGVGIGYSFVNSETNIGYQLTTSLSNAEVIATDGLVEDYFAWEGGIKFGLFSNISIYAEAGIDLTELLFHDLRYDHHDFYYDEYHDNVDMYLGVGAGIQAGPIRITAFSRTREVDSKYWEAESEVFSGIQFSLNF